MKVEATGEILLSKRAALEGTLENYNAMVIAFSGGVDSTFLLAVACQILEKKVVAVTYASPLQPKREVDAATGLAKALGATHRIITTKSLGPAKLTANLIDRCYHCKKRMGEALSRAALEFNIKTIAHGANRDDTQDYRPGTRATEEMGWIAPLAQAGFSKADIRLLSKNMGLPTWHKPAMACLATRIPYGTPITKGALKRVDGAETVILSFGFSTCRVRAHGDVARVEVPPDELTRMLDKGMREKIVHRLRDIGFQHISLDLEGYVQGSMNRGIELE